MKERGVTSYQLQKMGFNRATYYAIKSGESVSTNTIDRLCTLLHCRVEEVMEHIEEEGWPSLETSRLLSVKLADLSARRRTHLPAHWSEHANPF